MKTPRDLLLDRHRHRSPVLDDIRTGVIAHEVPQRPVKVSGPTGGLARWLSFHRAAWSTLAAAWCVIIGLNLAARSVDDATIADAPVDSRAMLAGVREQRARLAQLLNDSGDDEVGTMRAVHESRPRSDADRVRKGAAHLQSAFA